jgi:predicted ATPase/class 3 adenylate cyclase
VTDLPSGTVTFLFTDVEGSTRIWEEHPDAMREALGLHDTIVRAAIEAHDGYVVKTTGDGFHAAFAAADRGVSAAIAAQRGLEDVAEPGIAPLRVRMGLHTGVASLRDGDYFGSSLNRAARLMGVAHGGQVVCSQATADLAREVLAEGVSFRDLGEHRLRDLTRAERVFQVCVDGLSLEFPALVSVDAFPGNLPLQVSSFIGRERDLARVSEALRDARVITLTGVGGVGKTRLALQVAAEVLPRFREGAWLVELAAVRDPDGVAAAFSATFGLTARVGQTLEQALVEFLGAKQLLLVVDNCEHLVEAVADVVDAIERSCPGVVILATSREALVLEGERILGVPVLAAPVASADMAAIAVSDAVELFVDRARGVDADFELGAGNAVAVAQVCRRLDGVPLAIELAAAQADVMSPSELAAALDHRFETLAGGRRRAVKRQQTLRATIDWSYDLLDETQRRLLARLAVFEGGCSREAVQAVCAGAPIEARETFGLLSDLVKRSLVVAERDRSQTRYRLLETIREYGEERLAELAETAALRARHGDYYAELVIGVGEELHGPHQVEAAMRYSAEWENIFAAMNHAIDTENFERAMRLISGTFVFGESPGFVTLFPIAAILEMEGVAEHPRYPSAVALGAQQAALRGERVAAYSLCDEALHAAERLDLSDRFELDVQVATTRAVLAYSTGMIVDAARNMQQSANSARAAGRDEILAIALGSAAMFYAMAGDTDTAIPLATEGLAIARAIGAPMVISRCLAPLAGALAESDPVQAKTLLRESIQLVDQFDDSWSELSQAVLISARLGDWSQTMGLAARAIRHLQWMGERPLLAAMLNVAARGLAPSNPESAAIIQGAAHHLVTTDATARQSRSPGAAHASEAGSADQGPPQASFVTNVRRETTALLRKTLGDEQLRELRAQGASMNADDAVAYTLANLAELERT